MVARIHMTKWNRVSDQNDVLKLLAPEIAENIKTYHASFPQYDKTPLANLQQLSDTLGVSRIWVKDESYRFGLNAFKVLGGSYAIGKIISKRLNLTSDELRFEILCKQDTRERLGQLTFVTATDGNHGRGVAWTAETLGHKSVVYMPKGSSQERLQNILNHGSDASITDMNYDNAVRLAQSTAEANGWELVQDTAWEGYEEIPTWIMQGYMTMALEAYQELLITNAPMPTHIFLQAGVGSMAAAVAGFFRNMIKGDTLKIIIVEPDKADCLYRTAKANNGSLHFVTDDMSTIMAGLACGEPSTLGWEVLRRTVNGFISCSDETAEKGMRILGQPSGNDPVVISGESGAVGIGLFEALMTNERYAQIREDLQLNAHSKVLFFSTEGDTDQASYKRILVGTSL